MPETFYIQPFGKVEPIVINSIEDVLISTFLCDVKVLSPLDMPLHAFSARRNQYSAPTILRRICRLEIGERSKVLAVTNDDLYVRGRNFIFGQAQLNGICGIISLHRLKTGDKLLFLERVRKEAVHEIGHTFGLMHCPRHNCVMRFSETVEDADLKPSTFCDEHREVIQQYLRL